MAYIGNTPEIGFNTLSVQKFNGDGACTQFTVSQPISDPNYLEVLVNNVQQEPYASYNVSSGLITFSEAPSIGANNIQVGLQSTSIVYFNNINAAAQLINSSITGNKIAPSTITVDKLTSNLNLSVIRTVDSANVNTLGIGGNVNIDVQNTSVFFFNASTTANVTFNIRGNTAYRYDAVTPIGSRSTISVAVKHGSTRHTANLYIDGAAQTLYYLANTRPNFQSITNQEINIFTYNIYKTAANAYIVTSSNSLYGLA